MRLVNKILKKERLEKTSGDHTKLKGQIPSLNKKHYRIIKGTSVGGDAPKDLLRVYQYSRGINQINNPRKWPIHIAKTGHKWYPIESIVEHLLNRLGQSLGLKMADSKLFYVNDQIRFFSRLFREDKLQVLEHGAELYWGYLSDKEFVEQIEANRMAREFFTVSFTYETLKNIYPHQADDIFIDFVKMLVFGAIIGNNDRHFYNWGILKHLEGKHQPYFSPIYDTARALFWNRSEDHLIKMTRNSKHFQQMLENYVVKSKPKIGLEKNSNCNHFDIIKALNGNFFKGTNEIVNSLVTKSNKNRCLELINDEFALLLSKERINVITKCLSLRFDLLFKEIE